jgi:pimeloyl-ACP methyl ester carboxylesterase
MCFLLKFSLTLVLSQTIYASSETILRVSEKKLAEAVTKRSLYSTVVNTTASLYKEIKFIGSRLSTNPEATTAWKKHLNPPPLQHKHRSLIVLLHGLNSHPSIWNKHIETLAHQFREDLVWAPAIIHKGNCSLKTAAEPILAQIITYLKHQNKPLVLIGASNGARIALYLELKSRKFKSSILTISIAGPHLGTTKIPFRYFHTDEQLYAELSFQNQSSRTFIKALRAPLPKHAQRKHIFYGSLDDIQVSPSSSAFPTINQKEEFYLMQGVDHNGLIQATLEHQLASYRLWINS